MIHTVILITLGFHNNAQVDFYSPENNDDDMTNSGVKVYFSLRFPLIVVDNRRYAYNMKN